MQDKHTLAEGWLESHNLYSEYYTQFVAAMGFNTFQCYALRTLCEIAEEYARLDTEARQAGLTFDEALALCREEATA